MSRMDELADLLPAGAVVTDPDVVAARSRDRSPLALLRAVRGDAEPAGAVAFPASTEEVADVLAWAERTRTPVVPRGAGSGVCGGAGAGPDVLVLDLSRMDAVLAVDEEAAVVHAQAGVIGSRLEEEVNRSGLTLGHFPQSIAISSLGGWIAAASAGQASTGYGAVEDLLLGLTAVLAGGRVLRLRPVPRSAAGPDLRRLLVGSEGTLAVVTDAHLACRRLPSGWRWEGFRFPSFDACLGAIREVVRAETGAAVLRGYDDVDAALTFGAIGHPGGSAAVAGLGGDDPGVDARLRAIREAAALAGGDAIGPAYGERWWERRNDAVELYERVMGPERLFGPGVVVDTMEMATLWSSLAGLYRSVREALTRRAEAVACHLSHAYPAGASLYFTLLVRGADDRDVEAAYLEAWAEAVAACHGAGGTMTHHHGVGRLKAPFLRAELGEEGLRALRRVKEALDPSGILNPGALLP